MAWQIPWAGSEGFTLTRFWRRWVLRKPQRSPQTLSSPRSDNPAGVFAFRIRFKFPEGARLPVNDPTWTLEESGDRFVYMASLNEQTPITETDTAVLYGVGYANAEDAEAAGLRWRSVLQIAFARLNIGVDFYERSPELSGRFTEHGLAMLAQKNGRRVVNDQAGVVVYQGTRPLFASARADGVVKPSMRRAAATFAAVSGLGVLDVTRSEHLAFELYAASFFQPSADARLLMAMMAIETLIDPEPRSPTTVSLVEDLMQQVRTSGLPGDQISSLLGAMEWLKKESIGQAGRRVVSVLGDRKYLGVSPAKFFTKCYTLRSALVHGHLSRPERSDVDVHASVLQSLVGELLGRRVLHVTEEWLDEQDHSAS